MFELFITRQKQLQKDTDWQKAVQRQPAGGRAEELRGKCLSYDTNKSLQLLSEWRQLPDGAKGAARRSKHSMSEAAPHGNEKMPIPKWMCDWKGATMSCRGLWGRLNCGVSGVRACVCACVCVPALQWCVSNPFNLSDARWIIGNDALEITVKLAGKKRSHKME